MGFWTFYLIKNAPSCAPINSDNLPGNGACLVRHQKENHVGNIVGLDHSADGNRLDGPLFGRVDVNPPLACASLED